MLLIQPAKCSKRSPFYMELLNIKEHPWHMHNENTMEVIYVLKGTLECNISIYSSVMKQGDIAVVNTETLHNYRSDSSNIVLLCHIDLLYFSSVIDEIEDTLIVCNSASSVEYDKHYELLRKALASVFVYYFEIHTPVQDELIDSCISFLSVLYNHFNFLRHEGAAIQTKNVMKQKPAQAEHIKRVIKYVYDNFGSKISLEDIAAKEYVSKYYLSHLISEFLNMPFREYLNMSRTVYAQEFLYGTDMSLTAVADQCGFSGIDAFRKAYQKYTGVTPADDRKRVAGCTIRDIPFRDKDALLSGSIQDIAALIHVKTLPDPVLNVFSDTPSSVTGVSVNFADLTYEKIERVWDTVALDDPSVLLSHKTLEALSILREHGCFKKLQLTAEMLTSLYRTLGSWEFMGTFLKTLKREGFALLIQEDTRWEKVGRFDLFEQLAGFSNEIGGAEIGFVRETPAGQDHFSDFDCNNPTHIIADCLSGISRAPSLFDSKSGKPYLFDGNNLKTKAFYPYYFLNRLQPYRLYFEDGCCITHAKGKTAILLFNVGCGSNDDCPGNGVHAKKNDPLQKAGDTRVKKYMFHLKHLTKNLTYQCLTLDEDYASESEIFASLALDEAPGREILRRIQIKAYPDTKIAAIDTLPEYNLFLSSPLNTVTLIELS